MTQPLSSHGTLLQMGALGGGGPYTTVAELVDSAGPGIEQATHDAPAQDTAWMKRVAGITSAGDYSFDVNFIPKNPTHNPTTGLMSLIGLQQVTGWKLLYNDAGAGTASYWTWDAFLVTFSEDIPVDGILKSSVVLKINGEPVLTEGS